MNVRGGLKFPKLQDPSVSWVTKLWSTQNAKKSRWTSERNKFSHSNKEKKQVWFFLVFICSTHVHHPRDAPQNTSKLHTRPTNKPLHAPNNFSTQILTSSEARPTLKWISQLRREAYPPPPQKIPLFCPVQFVPSILTRTNFFSNYNQDKAEEGSILPCSQKVSWKFLREG